MKLPKMSSDTGESCREDSHWQYFIWWESKSKHRSLTSGNPDRTSVPSQKNKGLSLIPVKLALTVTGEKPISRVALSILRISTTRGEEDRVRLLSLPERVGQNWDEKQSQTFERSNFSSITLFFSANHCYQPMYPNASLSSSHCHFH